jgi:hypothetical protein
MNRFANSWTVRASPRECSLGKVRLPNWQNYASSDSEWNHELAAVANLWFKSQRRRAIPLLLLVLSGTASLDGMNA